jgi:hypothetical protein
LEDALGDIAECLDLRGLLIGVRSDEVLDVIIHATGIRAQVFV